MGLLARPHRPRRTRAEIEDELTHVRLAHLAAAERRDRAATADLATRIDRLLDELAPLLPRQRAGQ